MQPGGLFLVRRGLQRALGLGVSTLRLPNGRSVALSIRRTVFDKPEWDRNSTQSFRNDLESRHDGMHNRVHGWVGGHMGRGHSSNDPIFFLHHCNVDRIWAFWQSREGAAKYQPGDGESADLLRHRLSDACLTLASDPLPGVTNADMLNDPSATYDSFADLQGLVDNIPVG